MPAAIRSLVLLLLLCAISAAADPRPFRAVYKADYRGLPVGATGVRELKRLPDGNYLLTSTATSMLGSIAEQSRFEWKLGHLVPSEYSYKRRGIGRDRDARLTFDWNTMQVRNDIAGKPWMMAIDEGALDKLGYQLQIREDLKSDTSPHARGQILSYQIADGGRLKSYDFAVEGEEWINTDIGRVRTLKVARSPKKGNRRTVFWLAIDWDYLLVRLKQSDGDSGGFELLLESAELAGKSLGAKK